jgi:hypothetical protein
MVKLPVWRSNTIGVPGVSIGVINEKSVKKNKAGWWVEYRTPAIYWRVSYKIGKKFCNQKYRFRKSGGCRKTFEDAVRRKRDEQLREYGETNIVLAKMGKYYKHAVKYYKASLKGYTLT